MQIGGKTLSFIVAACLMLLTVLFSPYGHPLRPELAVPFWAALASASLLSLYFAVHQLRGGQSGPAHLTYVAVALLLLFGLAMRLGALEFWGAHPLEADARTYFSDTKNFNLFSVESWANKSPALNLLQYGVLSFAGFSAGAVRAAGFIPSLLLLPAMYFLARRYVGQSYAFLLAAVLAVLPAMAWSAVRGLREDLVALMLVLLLLVLTEKSSAFVKTGLMAGLLAALAVLARVDILPFVLLILAFSAAQKSLSLRAAAAAALTLAVIVGLHFSAVGATFGLPTHHSQMQARWLANAEFVGRPGFATPAQFENDSYTGGPLSPAKYVFGLHTPFELAKRVLVNEAVILPAGTLFYFVRGHTEFYGPPGKSVVAKETGFASDEQTVTGEMSSLNAEKIVSLGISGALYLLLLVGLVVALFAKERTLAFFALAGMLAYTIVPFEIFDFRVLAFLIPIFAILIALGLRTSVGLAQSALKRVFSR